MAKPPVVDIHAHFYPKSYMQVLAQHGYSPGTIYSDAAPADASSKSAHTYKRPDPAFTDIAQRIAAMDSQGVTVRQALSTLHPGSSGKTTRSQSNSARL